MKVINVRRRFVLCRPPMGGLVCWELSGSWLRRHVCLGCRADLWAAEDFGHPEECPACGHGFFSVTFERLSRETADTLRLESMGYTL